MSGLRRTGWSRTLSRCAALVGLTVAGACASGPVAAERGVGLGAASGAGAAELHLYIANESSDVVSHVVFEPGRGARVEREIDVDVMPGDIDGPHGIAVSPDGERWYVTVAHGTPYGSVWAFRTSDDVRVGRSELGRFPATIATAAGGSILVVANFDLHGDPVPSELSVVHAPDLTELTRIRTCVTPHGGRTDASGGRHYSVCMRSDQLVEVDLSTYRVSGRFSVRPGGEGVLHLDDLGTELPPSPRSEVCSPTWVTPGVRGEGRVYVVCNASGEVLEVDVESWEVTRRFDVGSGPYNLAITPDGERLLATLKSGQALAVVDLAGGAVEARLETSRPITHGVVVDPAGRFAFVTNESVGAVPGTLDIFDLDRMERVDTLELRHQPGGIGLRVDR